MATALRGFPSVFPEIGKKIVKKIFICIRGTGSFSYNVELTFLT